MDAPVVLTARERDLLVALAKLRASCSWEKFLHRAWPHLSKASALRALRTAIRRLTENLGEEFVDALGIRQIGSVFEPLDRTAMAVIIGTLVEHGHIADARACLEKFAPQEISA